MNKYFQISIITVLFFTLSPFGFINSVAWPQEPNKQPVAGPVGIPENYVIGKGDVLKVFVWRNEQLSGQVTVRPDGKISLPLIQDLSAEGLTALELKDRITGRLKEYVQNPTVTVIVDQINSYKVNVQGGVVSPGIYLITGDTTLVEAISMAGGFTEQANKKKITVMTHEGGKKKKATVNYEKIVSGENPSENMILKRGDAIIVNEIDIYKVSVLGRVTTPGVYPITGDTTLVEAISMAGGFTRWANKRKITVIRSQGGEKKKLRINYKKIVSGKDPSQNIILHRGDTIIVP